MNKQIDAIHEYWFGNLLNDISLLEAQNEIWYGGDPAVDAAIKEQFGDDVAKAQRGELDHWVENDSTGRNTLALIILLDQFTRNIYRGRAEAFSADDKALQLTLNALNSGLAESMHPVEQVFFYMPTQHAEDLDVQNQGVAAFTALAERTEPPWKAMAEFTISFAKDHRDIIAQFGRFPHRNSALGRESTAEEIAFLQSRDSWFGQ